MTVQRWTCEDDLGAHGACAHVLALSAHVDAEPADASVVRLLEPGGPVAT